MKKKFFSVRPDFFLSAKGIFALIVAEGTDVLNIYLHPNGDDKWDGFSPKKSPSPPMNDPGTRNVVEENDVYDTNLETYDTSAIEVT